MPATVTARISKRARRVLKEIADLENASMTEVLERLIENRRRHLLLKRANEEYAKARAEEPEAWAAFCTEAEEWDQIGGDGLDEE